MIPIRLLPVVAKYIVRHRTRTLLTVLGSAAAMFLFCAVESMRQGVVRATRASADETTLVVYRENRFCPFSSELPESHARQIAQIAGVADVLPVLVAVNNCGTSLDVVTFRGVPADRFGGGLQLSEGSLEAWRARTDAALVGQRLAARRGLKVGDAISSSGITAQIAGIIDAQNPQEENSVFVHLGFLQRASGRKPGIVTQFNVTLAPGASLEEVSAAIDAELKVSAAPTWTASEKTFVGRAAADIVELVSFASWLGYGSLVAVFALVANAVMLSVQDRVKDIAVMQTLGYRDGTIARLIVLESVLLSMAGGGLGLAAAWLATHVGQFSLAMEGNAISIITTPAIVATGLALCLAIGVGAGLTPAWRAARLRTSEAFRWA
jgi:putative ABC transport system permease protein